MVAVVLALKNNIFPHGTKTSSGKVGTRAHRTYRKQIYSDSDSKHRDGMKMLRHGACLETYSKHSVGRAKTNILKYPHGR